MSGSAKVGAGFGASVALICVGARVVAEMVGAEVVGATVVAMIG